MTNVVPFKQKVTTEEYFGGCPHCGQTDGFLNIGRDHWFVCDAHKTKWWIGSNLFSCWRDETEDDWRRNEYRLANYISVEPVFPEPTPEEKKALIRHNRERELDEALGVVFTTWIPPDPDDPFNPFAELKGEREQGYRYIGTTAGTVHKINEKKAYEVLAVHEGGDGNVVARFLEDTIWPTPALGVPG